MVLYALNWQPKALQCDKPTSFIAQILSVVVAQKQRGLEAFGWKWLYIEMIYWLSIMAICIVCANDEHPMTVSMSLTWVSTERQHVLVSPFLQWNGCMVTSFQTGNIGRHCTYTGKQHAHCPILQMSVNGASTILCLASWIITGLCNDINT